MCNNPQVLSYLRDMEILYADIELWIAGSGLKVRREEAILNEEASGQYTATRLIFEESTGNYERQDKADNATLAELDNFAVDTGIPDLAAQHDHYLYDTPKR